MANPLSQVLQGMQKKTVTLGWDVVVAYNAQSLNDLFAAQYIQKVRLGSDLPPITTTLNLTTGVAINVENLTLGPPLISFDSNLSDQEVTVKMQFCAGELVSVETSGKVDYVTGYQSIMPGDGYQLTMVVPLDKVTGSDNHNVVTLNLGNANTYSANLLPGTTAASYLGQYFQSLFQKETGSALTYQVGTMVTGSSLNLTPLSFDIRTQPYPGEQGSDGAVLLLVATTFNPGGGNLPGSGFPYLIPDSYGCAIVVRNATLFENIIGPYYNTQLQSNPTFTLNYYSGSAPAAYLAFNGGNFDAGPVNCKSPSTAPLWYVWTGTRGSSGSYPNQNLQSVMVPYDGWILQPDNDLLTMSWNGHFSQEMYSIFWSMTGIGYVSSSHFGSVELTISAGAQLNLSITSTQQIQFAWSGSPSINITFSSSSFLQKLFKGGKGRDIAASQIAGAVKPLIKQAMQLKIPQVNTFAVNHLLFPANNYFNYTTAYIPGDLVAFGQIQPNETAFVISPMQSVVGAGQTLQFNATGSGTTTWTLGAQFGSISSSGLYTAPQTVHKAIPVVVNAAQGSNEASAIITVVPYGITIAPSYAMVFDSGSNPVTFNAVVLDGGSAPIWSISPSDASMGSISNSGVYTVPSTFPSDVEIATVTATSGNASVSALICLADVTIGLTVSPKFVSLGPSEQQPFTVEGFSPTWSILPEVGAIDQTGVYTAPAAITQAVTVLVIACADGQFYGIAPVLLQTTD